MQSPPDVEQIKSWIDVEPVRSWVSAFAVAADLLTIAASVLAFIVFFANRGKLAAALQLLLNYSFQTTLSELKQKLERLNEYNANEASDVPEIRNILQEISGQIRGNPRLRASHAELATKLEALAGSRRLLEPQKRAIVAEVREQLRNIEVNHLESHSRETP